MKNFITIVTTVLLLHITNSVYAKHAIIYSNHYVQDTTYSVFSSGRNGYGFNILVKQKILIHQPFIPALQGNISFATKADAEKIARLMLFKLKKNEMPPTVSVNELDSLHISHHTIKQ
jgi:hypothetical protein